MKFKSVYVSGLLAVWPVMQGMAQSELIKFGDFDSWIVRNIKESGIIGGDTKQLYEIGPDAVWNENKAYTNQGGSPWATSNVMAKVCGITKTNTSVYREKRGDGYCARLETHVEKVKVMGIVNIEVLAAGSVFLGSVPEPITNTSNPMSKLAVGIPFTKRPQAISFDYKVKLSDEPDRIRQTGFSRVTKVQGKDMPDVVCLLQKTLGRQKRECVRTTYRDDDSCSTQYGLVNAAKFPIKYGDMEQWVTRKIHESSIIGGNTRLLYEIAPTQEVDGNVLMKIWEGLLGGHPM